MTAIQSRTYTPADLLRMPDASGVELVNGELVEKPVSVLSALVEGTVYAKIRNHCDAHQLGIALTASNGIQCFPNHPTKVRKPDVVFVRRDRFSRENLLEGFLSIPPDLAVEVISSHDEFGEVTEKIEEYLAAGIPLVWVVDPENEIVLIHRKDGTVTKLHKQDELSGEDILPGFRCKVVELFPESTLGPQGNTSRA